MAKVFVVIQYCAWESSMWGLYDSEAGARTRIYEVAIHHGHDGRIMWWPRSDGTWACQVLVPDFENSGRRVRYKWAMRSWEIQPHETRP